MQYRSFSFLWMKARWISPTMHEIKSSRFKLHIITFQLFCLFACLEFIVPLENFSLIWKRQHCRWRAAHFDLCLALMAIEQWGFFNVPHLLRQWPTVYNGHLRGWSWHYLFFKLKKKQHLDKHWRMCRTCSYSVISPGGLLKKTDAFLIQEMHLIIILRTKN